MPRRIEDEFIKETFVINDLGGQQQFRNQYLSEPTYFHNAAGIIFVVDCQDRDTIPSVEEYFRQILDQLETDPAPHRPLMAVFVHKFDPALRTELEDNIFNFWFPMLQKLFRRYDPPYYLTSIYDNTARESLARFFLSSMPKSIISKGISNEMILQAANSLYPMITKLEPLVQDDVDDSLLEQDLQESAQKFGQESAIRITKKWQEYLLQKEPDTPSPSENNEEFTLDLAIESTGHFEVSFQCPIPRDQWSTELCTITLGLFQGLGKQFGYHHVSINQTMIRDHASECKFSFSD